ncbi:MAG TPA: hypothetical protein VKZ50_01855 [bacterium]|nr:hypothetical protein [bacterium]
MAKKYVLERFTEGEFVPWTLRDLEPEVYKEEPLTFDNEDSAKRTGVVLSARRKRTVYLVQVVDGDDLRIAYPEVAKEECVTLRRVIAKFTRARKWVPSTMVSITVSARDDLDDLREVPGGLTLADTGSIIDKELALRRLVAEITDSR